MEIRPVEPHDQPRVVELIDEVFQSIGDRVFLEGADADLVAPHDYYREKKGAFVVLADSAEINGTHAAIPSTDDPAIVNFRRLYLREAVRGEGWGFKLMDWAVDWARNREFQRVEFWSDVRFATAHRFFKQYGFRRDGRKRLMHDGWVPYSEYFFYLDLG